MREILFRGKHKDNGEWVDGSLVIANDKINNGKYYILSTASDFSYGDNGNRCRIGCFVEVDPSTVGQFTGLRDKNGKKIFEGDLLKTHAGLVGRVTFGAFNDDEYESYGYGWYWVGSDINGDSYHLNLSPEWKGHEVCGDVHNNPELLLKGLRRLLILT